MIASAGQITTLDPCLAIQTHISENPSEASRTEELFSRLSTEGKPIAYTGVYDQYDLLRDNTALAYAIHFEEGELELMKEMRRHG